MKLYVMRHGTTVWNEKDITQGRSNNRLSKNGKLLTKSVAEKYKNTNFDVIICSPLMRAVQTANIMNKYHNVKVIKDEYLTEIDQGIFTGRKKDSLTKQERLLKASKSKKAKMESYEECYNRIDMFMKNINKYNYNSILIVTHNCCASFIEDNILKKKIDFSSEDFIRSFKNAEIKEFVI